MIKILKFATGNLTEERDEALLAQTSERLLLVIEVRWLLIGLLLIYGLITAFSYQVNNLFSASQAQTHNLIKLLLYPGLVLAGVVAYNTFYHIGWYKLPSLWQGKVKKFIFIQLLIDIVAVLALVHFTGGVLSWLWALFLVISLELSYLLSVNWQVLFMGALAGVGYSILVFLEYNHIIGVYVMPFLPHELHTNIPFIILMLLWVNLIAGCSALMGLYLHRTQSKELGERIVRDGLTNLYNRRYFNHRLNSEIKRAERYNRVVSLLLFDLDDFKKYNDTYGHVKGDDLLRWVADVMKHNIRRSDVPPAYELDIAFRYGGEEFAIILPETSMELSVRAGNKIKKQISMQTKSAVTVAERIRSTLSSAKFDNSKGITLSAGISCYPADGTNEKQIIEAADKALYAAKKSGKNKIILATPPARIYSTNIKPS